MQSSYGEKYNIRFLPKYVLIDKQGRIVNADVGEPSLAVEQLIEAVLRQ